MKRVQSGFTLIEIAVVLVIVSLLLGGVMKGSELLTQAKIGKISKDFDAVPVAAMNYQSRYKKLPGDDESATGDGKRWATPLAESGNGDGKIDPSTAESGYFWAHLRLGGFIAGDVSSDEAAVAPPAHDGGGQFVVARAEGLSGVALCASELPGKIAAAVDHQHDDGKPASGSMRGYLNGELATAPLAGGVYAEEEGSAVYTVCRAL
ncbi:MAG: prepilin-type N-terminal cleavage/methylation domain-containing protein [Gallionella sp.]|nr:prepilin-type N-terminal cleavage/methylation domain-containing protein [Gallionella sp.]